MKGWLITNKYFISNSLLTLSDLFLNAAKKLNIELINYNNIEVLSILSKNNYKRPDFVLFWDKDVKLALYLESEGIKVFNSSNAIRICDDKALTYLHLRNKNIKVPKTIFSPLVYYKDIDKDDEFIDFVISHLKFPFVFKECIGSFGKQVFLVKTKEELKEKIRKANVWPFEAQEFIDTSFGRDLRVYVVGDKVLGGMKRISKNGDFRANIELGSEGHPYDLNENEISLALKSVKELKLDFAGVDILFGKNEEPILCEVNSNAFFIEFDRTLGVHVEDNILNHIVSTINK